MVVDRLKRLGRFEVRPSRPTTGTRVALSSPYAALDAIATDLAQRLAVKARIGSRERRPQGDG